VTAPPPPPPPAEEPLDPTLVGAPVPARRTVVDEGPPPPVVRPYPWWLWLLVVLFLAAATLFGVLWLLERNDNGKNVPVLTGLTAAEAADRASARGFTLTTVRVPNRGAPGRVVDQAPQAGADLEKGARVMVVVSAGRQQVTVPKLIGSTADAAEQLLTAQNLQANKKSVDSRKPKGTVVAQDPTDGTRVPQGSTVTLSVSSGQGQVKVPAVQGTSQADALTAITDAGLVPIVIQVPSQQPEGTVIAQDPPANQQVQAQSKVRINVSGGQASTQTLTVTTSQTTTATTSQTTTSRVTTTTP
jgi:beta-lactam-binding protein with PASTA domain